MRFPLFLSALLASFLLHAQAPQAFDFQGVARDAGGQVLASQPIALRINLHAGSPGGTVAYQETHTATTSPFGLFKVQVGNGTPTTGSFSTVDWGASSFFIQVEMDATGGTDFIDMGTTQLLSVPYALHAKAVDCFSVSLLGDTLKQGNGCYVIIPGISAANGGCKDADGDGYNDQAGCGTAVDCDDNNPNVHPGATELCNGIDDNCNGQVDEGCSTEICDDGIDNDGNGLIDCDDPACAAYCAAIDADGDGYNADVDCDDNNSNVHPGATELCNGIDDNCNGQVDEGCSTEICDDGIDNDGNGLIDCDDPACAAYCAAIDADGDGYNADVDCDDNNPNVHPGATELCNGIDDNCNGQVDEGLDLGQPCGMNGIIVCDVNGGTTCQEQ